jgi:hypothetical protein
MENLRIGGRFGDFIQFSKLKNFTKSLFFKEICNFSAFNKIGEINLIC